MSIMILCNKHLKCFIFNNPTLFMHVRGSRIVVTLFYVAEARDRRMCLGGDTVLYIFVISVSKSNFREILEYRFSFKTLFALEM